MGMVDGHSFGKPFPLSKNEASCWCYFLVKIRTMREIYNTKRAKSEHAAGYGIEPKNSAGCGICLNFLAEYRIRTPYDRFQDCGFILLPFNPMQMFLNFWNFILQSSYSPILQSTICHFQICIKQPPTPNNLLVMVL